MYSVLVVDDEQYISKGIRLMLERSGLPIGEIREAEDGIQAMELLKEKIFNIIITDIRMPKMDGLELCRRIYKKCRNSAIIIISGYGDFKYAQEAIKYGVKEFLLKPVQRDEIFTTVSAVINELKSSMEVLYVEYRDLEFISDKISSGIWSQQNSEIDEGFQRLHSVAQSLPIDYCLRLETDLITRIFGQLSLKIGYELRLDIEPYKGNDKEYFHKWFENMTFDLLKEINLRRANADYNLFEMARQYIRDNYSSDFSLDDVAKKTGFSTAYFSQLFKKNTGKSFVQYRNEVRMQKAMELLNQPNRKVLDVALDVGYNDVTYFIKAFKEYAGVTPAVYKKRMGKES